MADADSTSIANARVSAAAGKRRSFEDRKQQKKRKLDTSIKKDAAAVQPLMSVFIPKTTGVLQCLIMDMCQVSISPVCLLYELAL